MHEIFDNKTMIAARGKTIYTNPFASPDGDAEYTFTKMSEGFEYAKRITDGLSDLVGQDHVKQKLSSIFFDAFSTSRVPDRPLALFFAGPSAVGKSFVCDRLPEILERPHKKFWASEHTDSQVALCSLVGITKSFKEARSGQLSSYALENPFAVIIIEEIDKAIPEVLQLFLNILSDGYCYDNFLEENISFRNNIIVFTANSGRELWQPPDKFIMSNLPQSVIAKALVNEKMPEAFVSRIGNTVMFNKLRHHGVRDVLILKINDLIRRFDETYNLHYNIDAGPLAQTIMMMSCNADVGALQTDAEMLFRKINKESFNFVKALGNATNAIFNKISINISHEKDSEDVKMLFNSKSKPRILVSGCDFDKEYFLTRSNVETFFADSVDAINDLDLSFAFFDVKNEASKYLFKEAVNCNVECYVYSTEEVAESKFDFYVENGSTECFVAEGDTLKSKIDKILESADFSYMVESARRSSKIVEFDTDYAYNREEKSVTVTLHKFRSSFAIDANVSNAFVKSSDIPNVNFSDIIGISDAVDELKRAAYFMRNYKLFNRQNISMPSGLLLCGAPGTGKTMLAKAVAKEAGLPFSQANATEFISKWVGEGAKNVREIFDKARMCAPSILFIDEIDAIAKNRMSSSESTTGVQEITNAFLSQMDGFLKDRSKPVFVIAATNFSVTDGSLDPAFLRRFNKKICLPHPRFEDRKEYLSRELAKVPNSSVSEEQIDIIAKRAVGVSLADLSNIKDNAVREYVYKNNGVVGMDFDTLRENYEAYFDGAENEKRKRSEIKIAAYHEASHAFVSYVFNMQIIHATIISRGGYGGFVQYSEEDKHLFTKNELLNRISAALAGRAGESVFFGEDGITTGANGDLEQAKNLAMQIIDCGMYDGCLVRIDRTNEAEMNLVRSKIQDILSSQYEKTRALIERNREKVECLANALLCNNSLCEDEIKAILTT